MNCICDALSHCTYIYIYIRTLAAAGHDEEVLLMRHVQGRLALRPVCVHVYMNCASIDVYICILCQASIASRVIIYTHGSTTPSPTYINSSVYKHLFIHPHAPLVELHDALPPGLDLAYCKDSAEVAPAQPLRGRDLVPVFVYRVVCMRSLSGAYQVIHIMYTHIQTYTDNTPNGGTHLV